MTKTIRILTSCLPFLTIALSAACTPQPVTCKAPAASAGALSAVEMGNTQFATDLFAQLAQQQSASNFFYSPYSISAALAITYRGAANKTAEQTAAVLHLAPSAPDVALAFAQLDCQIETDGQASGNQLNLANGLFAQQGSAFEPAFLSALQTDFGAPLQQVDFLGNAGSAINTIDQWVSDRTQGQVPQLLGPGSLDQKTRLVLADAIYFKGHWATAFDPSYTRPDAFSVTATEQVETPLMNLTANLNYTQGQGFSMVELGYLGGKIAMDIVLPDAVDGLPTLVGSFTAANFASWIAQLQFNMVEVTLPKFTFQSSFNMNDTLQRMGMPLAFDPSSADFSGIDGQHDLFIGAMVHQATLAVDEFGTVAAAASVVTGNYAGGSEVPIPFNANHPFLFVLRDLGTGTLLFAGQVTNPTKN